MKTYLDRIVADLDDIRINVKKISDSMDNKTSLDTASTNLQNSVSALSTYGPLGVATKSASSLSSLKVTETKPLPQIKVEFFEGHPVNILNLDEFKEQISAIRMLCNAILWISLFIYLIAILVPTFKM